MTEPERQRLIAAVVAGAAARLDGRLKVWPIGSHATLGAPGANLDPALFIDGVHPTAASYVLMAAHAKATILGLPPDEPPPDEDAQSAAFDDVAASMAVGAIPGYTVVGAASVQNDSGDVYWGASSAGTTAARDDTTVHVGLLAWQVARGVDVTLRARLSADGLSSVAVRYVQNEGFLQLSHRVAGVRTVIGTYDNGGAGIPFDVTYRTIGLDLRNDGTVRVLLNGVEVIAPTAVAVTAAGGVRFDWTNVGARTKRLTWTPGA